MPHADPEARREYQRRYYRENRERIIARVRTWDAANPELAKARGEAWKEQHPEKVRAHGRAHYLANRDEVITRGRFRVEQLRVEDAETFRAGVRDRAARRRARQREATVEPVNSLLVWERDGGLCGICGEVADVNDWHLDHVIPLSKGGDHSYANVRVTHPICNWRKAAS